MLFPVYCSLFINSDTHSNSKLMGEAAMQGAELLNQQYGFQYFAQGNFNMQQKVPGNRFSDLVITSRPVLPVLHDTQARVSLCMFVKPSSLTCFDNYKITLPDTGWFQSRNKPALISAQRFQMSRKMFTYSYIRTCTSRRQGTEPTTYILTFCREPHESCSPTGTRKHI